MFPVYGHNYIHEVVAFALSVIPVALTMFFIAGSIAESDRRRLRRKS